MKIFRFRSFLLLIVLSLFSQSELFAQTTHARLWIETLYCAKTTENGEDEVYVLTSSKKSSEKSATNSRLPGNGQHWSTNDSGAKQNLHNIFLWEGDLANGEWVDVYVALMEEDGGTPQDILDKIAIFSDVFKGLAEFLNKFPIQDTDDFQGSFQVRIKNVNGTLVREWYPIERTEDKGVPPNHTGPFLPHEFWAFGDGANYRIYLRAQP